MRRPPSLCLCASFLGLVAACGGVSSDGDPDAGGAPDTPLIDGPIHIEAGGQTVTTIAFARTAVGQRDLVRLRVRNVSATAIPALALALVADGSGFAIDAAGSTCDDAVALAPTASCELELVFAPQTPGDQHATLRVAVGDAVVELPLSGTGVAPTGVYADVTSLDLGEIALGSSASATVTLINAGTATATLGTPTVTGSVFRVLPGNCGASLTPGGACTLDLVFHNTGFGGVYTGALSVPTGTGPVEVALRGSTLASITVQKAGSGNGTVTSSPAGIECGPTCTAIFHDGPVTLTAVADASSTFVRWDWGTCGTEPTCVVPAYFSARVTATFLTTATARTISITLAGSAHGQVLAHDPDDVFSGGGTTCKESCNLVVEAGTKLELVALTPSTFGGWTGDCAGSTSTCDLGTIVNNRAATATFVPDDREILTLLNVASGFVDYAPDGNLLVGGGAKVWRLSPTGAVRWTTEFPSARGLDLESDADGNAYNLQLGALSKLSPNGAVLWTRPVPGVECFSDRSGFPSWLSTAPSGDVATLTCVNGRSQVHVFDAAGGDRWSVTGLPHGAAIAIDPDGGIAVAVDDGVSGEHNDLLRYAADGTPLPGLGNLPGQYYAAMTYDQAGYLVGNTSGHGTATVSRIAPDGVVVFENTEDTGSPEYIDCGVAVDSDGDIVTVRQDDYDSSIGMVLEVLGPTGDWKWFHHKYGQTVAPDTVGVTPFDVTADAHKHIAVSGDWRTPGGGGSWIAIYAMP